ncbi:MarR family transcriptional regulator [uncultured Roseobacter sp.]|uniref:MarR family winged helix-turn-helix transcriptional regulator n=1 Tax=uncultured Roseobacter sp. TaxID=114847 RepID=UPI00261BE355|nr:MarR family transcriptional regulator [uncultured Roseobacter sp.]
MNNKQSRDRFATPELVVAETGKFVPQQQAYLNLIRAAEVLSAPISELMAAHGLSGKQYNALRSVRRGGETGLSISEIGAQMTDPRADVTRLVDRLLKAGLVERYHDEADRRVVRVRLTEAGSEALNALDVPLLDAHRAQFQNLSGKELERLIALLRKAYEKMPSQP